jgi:hypothetical protein
MGITSFFRILFSPVGLLIGIYIFVGIWTNTAAPHFPSTTGGTNAELLHNWIQYGISVAFWPLAHWQPTFTTGEWLPMP